MVTAYILCIRRNIQIHQKVRIFSFKSNKNVNQNSNYGISIILKSKIVEACSSEMQHWIMNDLRH